MKKIYLKLITPRGKIRKYSSNITPARIYNKIEANHFSKAYVKVSYGKQKCIEGCVCEFYNDAWATDKKELKKIIRYFWSEKPIY